MKYENGIILGKHCMLRPVEVTDAEFILALRNEERRSRFISKSVQTAEDQRKWILSYLERYTAGMEYYFIACDFEGTSWGTVRIYGIVSDECTGGSWVMLPGAPIAVALETYLLPMRFVFEILSKKVLHVDVRKKNSRVRKWHEMCGAVFMREDDLDCYYDYSPATYSKAEELVYKSI